MRIRWALSLRRASLLIVLAWGACAYAPAVLRTGADRLTPDWTQSAVNGASIAVHHAGGGTMIASVSCDAVDEDAPLDVLVNHLLLQLDSVVELGRDTLSIDGRAAMRAHLNVRLDGVRVSLVLVVFKKDGCVVDAQLAVREGELPLRTADFETFVARLSMTRRRR